MKDMWELFNPQFLGKNNIVKLKQIKDKFSVNKSKKIESASCKNYLLSRYGDKTNHLNLKELKCLHHLTKVLDRLEEKINIVYDIGANNGIWAEAFSLYTDSLVYAFEPLPKMIVELYKRHKRSPLIKVQPVACGSEQMRTEINEEVNKIEASSILEMSAVCKSEFSHSKLGESHPETIEVVRLDEWVDENNIPLPSLIKVDVQGYENNVIDGGVETLKNTKYVWVELCFKQLYVGGSTFETIHNKLNSLGFQLIDCIDIVRSKSNDQPIYMDGIFINQKK